MQLVVTTLRNRLRAIVTDGNRAERHTLDNEYEQLLDVLYGSQLLISEQAYGLLHQFKNAMKRARQVLSEEGANKPDDNRPAVLRSILDLAEDLHANLQATLRTELKRLEEI